MEKISVKIDYKELLVNFWITNHENPRGIFYIHHGICLLYTSDAADE